MFLVFLALVYFLVLSPFMHIYVTLIYGKSLINCMYVCLSVCLSARPSVCMPVRLPCPARPAVRPSVCQIVLPKETTCVVE